ncbi:MAG: helix-turn-helix domain-containing protein [Chloroflexia bacterium]|nr:helix-turn-helix domain-containing protein [Chloroflexia bacterium]
MGTLGARLRQLRRERGCTLQEVSDGSKLTPSFLSRLERGIVNISVGNLRKVAAFFDVPITYFFTEDLVPQGIVVRAEQARPEPGSSVGVQRCSLLPQDEDLFAAELIFIAPDASTQQSLFEGSRVLFYTLSGRVRCHIAGREIHLQAGDAVYQRRPSELCWSNPNPQQAVLLAASLRTEER